MSTFLQNLQLIAIKTCQGIRLINPMEIVWCETTGKTAAIHIVRNECIKSGHTLKELEDKFHDYPLIRCHAKYIVNIGLPLSYNPKTREIELNDKQIICVAKNRNARFRKLIEGNGHC
jgi:DNA-binding LytR/AlgR family response regulator